MKKTGVYSLIVLLGWCFASCMEQGSNSSLTTLRESFFNEPRPGLTGSGEWVRQYLERNSGLSSGSTSSNASNKSCDWSWCCGCCDDEEDND